MVLTNKGAQRVMETDLVLASGNWKLILLAATVSSIDKGWDNLTTLLGSANRLTAQNYPAADYSIAGVTVHYDNVADEAWLECDIISLGTLGPTPNDTIAAFMIYDSNSPNETLGGDLISPNVTTTGGTLNGKFPAGSTASKYKMFTP